MRMIPLFKHSRSAMIVGLTIIANSFFSNLFCQYLEVYDTTMLYDKTERPCIAVLMEPGTKAIKDHINDWMRKEHDVRLKGFGFLANADVLTAEEVRISGISGNQMDFYVSVLENGDYSEMCVFGSFGYNIHITPKEYPAEFKALKELVFHFLDDFLPIWYQEQIDETQDLVTDLEKERDKIQDDIADNEKEIQDLQKENVENKEELEKLKLDLQKNMDILEMKRKKGMGIHSKIEVNKQRHM